GRFFDSMGESRFQILGKSGRLGPQVGQFPFAFRQVLLPFRELLLRGFAFELDLLLQGGFLVVQFVFDSLLLAFEGVVEILARAVLGLLFGAVAFLGFSLMGFSLLFPFSALG